MIKITYEILGSERERLKSINDVTLFEEEMSAIHGQFQMSVTNKLIGFVDKDIPYEGELLTTWFQLLNKALYVLETNGFVTIYEPDSLGIWIEFQLISSDILMRRIKAENNVGFSNLISCQPIVNSEVLWSEEVNKMETYNAIIEATDNYIKDVLSLNRMMTDLGEIKKLLKTNSEVRELLSNNFLLK